MHVGIFHDHPISIQSFTVGFHGHVHAPVMMYYCVRPISIIVFLWECISLWEIRQQEKMLFVYFQKRISSMDLKWLTMMNGQSAKLSLHEQQVLCHNYHQVAGHSHSAVWGHGAMFWGSSTLVWVSKSFFSYSHVLQKHNDKLSKP